MSIDLTALAYRALWELDGRSGFKALRTPVGAVFAPSSTIGWGQWLRRLPHTHRLRSVRYEPRGAAVQTPPPPWHREPLADADWPRDEHWTRAMKAGVGDLRLTWEPNRFGAVWRWIDDQADAADAFLTWVADWRENNPFRAGVNWASGQELALRTLAWLAGAAAYGDRMTDREWADLVELFYWHGVHIASETRLAKHSVANNHALAEALALAALGDAFGPDFAEARRWRADGLAWLQTEVARQFLPDGGYCQHSHAYHHFALELLLEALRWFPTLEGDLSEPLQRSQRFLAVICEPDGSAPNFGPNDRATPTSFSSMLADLEAHTNHAVPVGTASGPFPDAGLHVLRAGTWTATTRCGALAARAGHDDALHVEVWHAGKPVAIDAGSHLYLGDEHAWFSGAASHNVFRADHREPRRLLAPFTRVGGPDPELVEFDRRRGHLVAIYDGYAPIRWERRVHVTPHRVQVVDFAGSRDCTVHQLTQHWLLNCESADVDVTSVADGWRIAIGECGVSLLLDVEGAEGHVHVEDARQSLAYGSTEPAMSVTLSCECAQARLRARFVVT